MVQDVTTDDMEIVSALRAALADRVGQQRFDLWFGTSTRLTLRDGVLLVEVPNRFYQDWLRANFRKEVESCCLAVFGKPMAVEFRVDPDLENLKMESGPADGKVSHQAKANSQDSAESNGKGGPSSTRSKRRRRFAELTSFVVGHSNRVAHASAQMVAERPGCLSPLFLHGPIGVGKTHLLEGIWSAATKQEPQINAVLLSAEQFTTGFLEALHHSGLPSFRRKYRSLELLILDDIQFFTGKRATLVEVLHTVDTLLRDRRQLVFSADRPPDQIEGLGPELASRLSGGIVCPIDPPDHQTRLGILRRLVAERDMSVPDEVLELVAVRFTAHARELSGAINRLHATGQALGKPITVAMAGEALANMASQSQQAVRLADIEHAVCDVFGLSSESLRSQRKSRSVSHPRMLAMWLARKYTRAALSEIGDFFGRRSHTTVISAQKRVNDWMARGKTLELPERSWNIEEAIRRVEQKMRIG